MSGNSGFTFYKMCLNLDCKLEKEIVTGGKLIESRVSLDFFECANRCGNFYLIIFYIITIPIYMLSFRCGDTSDCTHWQYQYPSASPNDLKGECFIKQKDTNVLVRQPSILHAEKVMVGQKTCGRGSN